MGRRNDFSELEITLSGQERKDASSDRLVLVLMSTTGVSEYDLAAGELVVGRAPRCQIVIDAPSVSRTHATLVVEAGSVKLHDLASTNGTFLNGVQITKEAQPVKHGDSLRFGDIVAHVKARRTTRRPADKIISETAFEQRLVEEAERAVRYNRSLTVLAIESAEPDARVEKTLAELLRALDAAVARGPRRFDIIAPECDRTQAALMAHRMLGELTTAGHAVRIGVATFPGDVPSANSLCVGAEMAFATVAIGAIGSAREGVRHLLFGGHEIVIAEPSMTRLFGMIERVARTNAPVLVHGETGSGKEIVAEALHSLSNRANRKLVRINCAAVPAHLVETELFGHVRGAFSGADRDKVGLIEEANGGTLFLDEIGEFELGLQAKLLRVLEDGRIRRVGATNEIAVDIRVVAATNRDLKAEAAAGRFRQDLYYRLGAIVLSVPPLRERVREIPLLVERFLLDEVSSVGRNPPRVSSDAMAMFTKYAWPGNVRELRNAVQRALVLSDGQEILPEHIDLEVSIPPAVPAAPQQKPAESDTDWERNDHTDVLSLGDELRERERRRIIDALEECGGNQTRAAELLQMPRRTLVYKLRTLEIRVARKSAKTPP